MGESAIVVGDADDGLRERLDAEINAFNAVATGCGDGRAAVRLRPRRRR